LHRRWRLSCGGSEIRDIFAERLKRCIRLSDAEAAFLDAMGSRDVHVGRHQMICRAGERVREAFVLKSGWAVSYSQFPDGSRQIRRLHLPGDLLGMPALALRHHPENLETLTPTVVSPFERAALSRLFVEHPRLTSIMYIFAQEERTTLGDRMGCIGRLDCKERLAFLLLDIFNRLRAIDVVDRTSFEIHLTREQMAEMTGMTSIHASRMWSELISERTIETDGHRVTILDEARLQALSGYVNRSADLDFRWIPDHGPSNLRQVDLALHFANGR
jgi:CRP/FNR family transcriptional regulator, anaerobic regulatory protein